MDRFKKLHALIDERCTEPGAYYFPDPWWEKEITYNIFRTIEKGSPQCVE